ncbi:MAG: hypothetical protein ABI862_15945 [Ilumatobacteraceae bacterium]
MPTVTLRPNGAYDDNGLNWNLVGAATAHAALSDNSDASYVRPESRYPVDFGTFSLPTTALTSRARLRVRAQSMSGGIGTPDVQMLVAGIAVVGASVNTPTSAAITDLIGAYVPVSWAQTDIDSLQASFDIGSGSLDLVRFVEAYIDVVYALQPSTAVSAPTGVVTNTTQPTVAWTHTPGTDGGPQSNYQVRVFSAAQYGIAGFNPATSPAIYDSGIVTSTATSAVVGPLPNSTTYRAYVRTAQSINGVAAHWADYAFTGFSIAATTPEVATVSATADDVNGRNRITVTRNSGTPYWATLDLQRSNDGGVTWVFVRGAADSIPPGDVWIGYDYEAGNGEVVIYRGRAVYGVPGLVVTGAWVTSGSVSWSVSGVDWLKDLRNPTNSMKVRLESLPATSRDRPRGVFSVIGRRDPVIISDVLHLMSGDMTLLTFTDTEADALDLLLDSNAVLLLQVRPESRFGSHYLSVGGVSVVAVVSQLPSQPAARWLMSFVEVAAPGDFTVDIPGLTWQDIIATYPTWTALIASVPTWGDLV